MIDTLSDIFSKLSVQGTLYFRTSFSGQWGVAVPAFENVARFHFAHRGDCVVHLPDNGRAIHLAQGDLMIIPHGARHDLISDRTQMKRALPLDQVLQDSGYKDEGLLLYGSDQGDRETQLICGHFSFAANTRHLLFDQLPDHIHIPNYGEAAGRWMEASLRMMGEEAGKSRFGGDLIALRLSEVILVQALRSFIEEHGQDHVGLAGFADPKLARALAAFHRQPANDWTVEGLAREAGLSRTGFAVQFAEKMGIPPMQYLTSWRMQIACIWLVRHRASISEVAARTGYSSESAFSRVFKKEMGQSPAAYRASA
ncbi:helix-turn-helix domain-containing protein [Epibacterium sp. SM1969]|uniref:Helix-turn-helix domain-containing protein n=1 Tax=Tritonibacter aquimaris TaxID=2663379 RepID=A0A844AZ28_9RHOB|nr:AraC family transcriptional regulator [Tritonibacter aquimaris]MQY43222.1 helix-turn-helix domain-containing protein [Tritonibacter aquimaris]